MTFKGHFPHMSPVGLLAFGKSSVRVVDPTTGKVLLSPTPGTRPHWIDDFTLAWFREGSGVYTWIQGSGVNKVADVKGLNFCAKNGSWGIYRPKTRTLVKDGVDVASNDIGANIAVDGQAWALPTRGERSVLLSNGLEVAYPAKVQIVADCLAPLVRCVNGRLYYGPDAEDVTAIPGEHHPVLMTVNGELWIATCIPGRVIIRRLRETSEGLTMPGNDAGLTCVAIDGHFLGASASETGVIETFKVPCNATLQPLSTDITPKPITPFTEHFYAACYKDMGNEAPCNVIFVADTPTVAIEPGQPVICGPNFVDKVRTEDIVGWCLAIEVPALGGSTEAVSTAARAAKAIKDVPVYAYMGSFVPSVPVDAVDVPILQAYAVAGQETPKQVYEALCGSLRVCSSAYPRVAIALETTEARARGITPWTATDRLECLQAFAGLIPVIKPVAVFAWCWDRQTKDGVPFGMNNNPAVVQQWAYLVKAIPEG